MVRPSSSPSMRTLAASRRTISRPCGRCRPRPRPVPRAPARPAELAFWLLALVAGGAAAGKVSQRLSTDFSLPGQPGYVTAQQVMRLYGNGGQAPSILRLS